MTRRSPGRPEVVGRALRKDEPAFPARAAARSAVVLWTVAAALVLARILAATIPGMFAWGLNAGRFVAPGCRWGLVVAAALPLVPAVARALGAALDRAGHALRARPFAAGFALAALAAGLVALLPDRTWFLGDFLSRYGTLEFSKDFRGTYPQAMPLDVLLHDSAPRVLMGWGFDPPDAARVVGCVEAALLGALAARVPAALALDGAAAAAAAGFALFGGWLAAFTGYLKTPAALCLVLLAAILCVLRVVRDGRGLVRLGLLVALGLTLHRSALLLVPVFAAAFAAWLRREPAGAWRRPRAVLALAAPCVALFVLWPRLAHVLHVVDTPLYTNAASARAAGGLASNPLGGLRPLDLANALLLLTPFAAALPALAWSVGPGVRASPESRVLATFACAAIVLGLVVYAAQGLFRDWDDVAPAGIALAMLLAWWAGLTVRAAPRGPALAAALVLGSAAPAVEWLVLAHDAPRGLARARAFLAEPPARNDVERVRTYDFLADRDAQLGRWDDAARDAAQAVRIAPSPRLLRELALAHEHRGDYPAALAAWRAVAARKPGDGDVWTSVARVAWQAGDGAAALAAADSLERLEPGNPVTPQVRAAFGDSAAIPPRAARR